MPYKKFEQMCDLQLAYNRCPTMDNQTALIEHQDKSNWPWSGTKVQIVDWNELCKRIDGRAGERIEGWKI